MPKVKASAKSAMPKASSKTATKGKTRGVEKKKKGAHAVIATDGLSDADTRRS